LFFPLVFHFFNVLKDTLLEDDLEGVTHKVYFDVEIDGKLAGIILLLSFLITKFGYLFDSVGFWELFLYCDFECDCKFA
jgi:hypothetical protein